MTLTLRPATWRDLPRLRRWRNDPETVRWSNGQRVGWWEHLRWWLGRHRRGSRVFVAMVDSGRYLGTHHVGAGRLDGSIVSYTVAPAWRGQGLGTELVAALVAEARNQPGPPWCLWAWTHPENLASRSVLLKNGFAPTQVDDYSWVKVLT